MPSVTLGATDHVGFVPPPALVARLRVEGDKVQRWLSAHVVAASEALRRPAARARPGGP